MIVFCAVCPLAFGLDLSDYPNIFVKNEQLSVNFVVGDNADIADAIGAVDVATSLEFYTKTHLPGAAKLASEIVDPKSSNLVVIGGPCANSIAAQLLGYPKNCLGGFVRGKAIVRLFDMGGTSALLIAGATAADTRRACRLVASYTDYKKDFIGTEIFVIGSSLTDVAVVKG